MNRWPSIALDDRARCRSIERLTCTCRRAANSKRIPRLINITRPCLVICLHVQHWFLFERAFRTCNCNIYSYFQVESFDTQKGSFSLLLCSVWLFEELEFALGMEISQKRSEADFSFDLFRWKTTGERERRGKIDAHRSSICSRFSVNVVDTVHRFLI